MKFAINVWMQWIGMQGFSGFVHYNDNPGLLATLLLYAEEYQV
jgi:hypothetical protein